MQDTTTPGIFHIDNGATADFSLPVWYMELLRPKPAHPHDRLKHDHLGWPDPRRPDHSCQYWDFARCDCKKGYFHLTHPYTGVERYNCEIQGKCKHYLDMRKVFPVHLIKEGYDEATIHFIDPPEGLTATASIDEIDDWVINLFIDVLVPSAIDQKIVVPYSVFVTRTDDDRRHRDIAAKGLLIIHPAPIG